jgi:hypothetical protein
MPTSGERPYASTALTVLAACIRRLQSARPVLKLLRHITGARSTSGVFGGAAGINQRRFTITVATVLVANRKRLWHASVQTVHYSHFDTGTWLGAENMALCKRERRYNQRGYVFSGMIARSRKECGLCVCGVCFARGCPIRRLCDG